MFQDVKKLQKTILVVDDTVDNLLLISDLLKDRYRVKTFVNPKAALEYLQTSTGVDLILLDIVMPELSGYDVIDILKQTKATQDIPVIFLTSLSSMEDEQKGLNLGASDYITKPISAPIMLSRIKTQLENKAAKDFLKDKNSYLEEEVQKRTKELSIAQDMTILTLASLAETRDTDTGNHLKRTQHYIKILAEALKEHPRFSSFLNDAMIQTLFRTAPLHDIGKVGIADKILLKPTTLSYEEFEIMKTHTILGKEAIEHAEMETGTQVDFLKVAKEIAYAHHENYDGSGYPLGLIGDAIPIAARFMALADVYDALSSRRVYKEPMPHEQAVEIIVQNRALKFDPDIVDVFVKFQNDFLLISEKYADSEFVVKQKEEQINKII